MMLRLLPTMNRCCWRVGTLLLLLLVDDKPRKCPLALHSHTAVQSLSGMQWCKYARYFFIVLFIFILIHKVLVYVIQVGMRTQSKAGGWWVRANPSANTGQMHDPRRDDDTYCRACVGFGAATRNIAFSDSIDWLLLLFPRPIPPGWQYVAFPSGWGMMHSCNFFTKRGKLLTICQINTFQ